MKNLASLALCGLAVLPLLCAVAATAPSSAANPSTNPSTKPADIPTKWELTFTCGTPKPISVLLPGQKEPNTFWYVEYTVINETNDEQIFVPEFILYTDTGQILRAGQNVPNAVFNTIKSEIVLNEPLLMDTAAISKMPFLRGIDHARKGVMIFTDIDPSAGSFDIFVGGLSGETVHIRPPTPVETVTTDREGKQHVVMKDEIILAKTLKLHYLLPGEASARSKTTPTLESKTWVMR